MKKIIMFSMMFLLTATIMGCGAGNDEALDNTNNSETAVTEGNNNGINDENDLDNMVSNTDNTERNIGADQDGNIEVADDAADRISELEEVDTATVLITDNNAYVAVVLTDGTDTEVTEEVKNKIADQVQEVDDTIQNVYVSSNPDFIERWTGFRDRINAGDPVEGFFEEFTQAVENVFPNRQS